MIDIRLYLTDSTLVMNIFLDTACSKIFIYWILVFSPCDFWAKDQAFFIINFNVNDADIVWSLQGISILVCIKFSCNKILKKVTFTEPLIKVSKLISIRT